MKKIIYLFAIITLVFTSCNPLEDVNEEVDALTEKNNLIDDIVYTLTEKDYKDDVKKGGLGLSFANFGSSAEAKELLPGYLAKKYPALGVTYKAEGEIEKASSAAIEYKYYSPKRTEKSLVVYEVTSADYATAGHNFGNFSNTGEVTAFLDTKYPNAANRMLVNLTYKQYNGATAVTLENGFIIVDGNWEMATGITAAEYTAMGQSRAQFNSEAEALAKIPLYAKTKFQFENKKAKDIEGIMYKLYVTDTQDIDNDGRTDDRTVYSFLTYVIYDGANWSIYNNILTDTLKFGHDGTKWVPDNTIKYTFVAADFELVGNGFYNNFDVRAGKAEETIEVRVTKINTVLKANFPNAAEGQKFSVTYAVYNGTDTTITTNVIKVGADYVLQ